MPDGQSFERQVFFYPTPGNTNNGASAPLTVVINEWMAGNTQTIANPIGRQADDWFELYNYGTNTVNLADYYLTNGRTNFVIPAGYTIPPHGFLLVWADKQNGDGATDLHVNFKLTLSGDSIGLFGRDGALVDYVAFGPQTSDISQGRYPDGSALITVLATPTPRTNNAAANTAPVLSPIGDKSIYAGQTLRFTATATDAEIAFQTLTFNLDPAEPVGASI